MSEKNDGFMIRSVSSDSLFARQNSIPIASIHIIKRIFMVRLHFTINERIIPHAMCEVHCLCAHRSMVFPISKTSVMEIST